MADTKSINLALQGGGAHGAFGWGVLDRLLEDGRLNIEGITATSAGTMNAIIYASGLFEGGPEGARNKLEAFWREVSRVGQLYNPISYMPWMNLPHLAPFRESYQKFLYYSQDYISRAFSPYQLNPLGINPLKRIINEFVDFETIRKHEDVKLFINATNVNTGQVRVFENQEVTDDVILASACLPFLFHAVEINGEHYWDGGFTGNPSLFPLYYNTHSRDIVIIHINPITRETLPTTAHSINNRVNEISFNSSLVNELRAASFVSKLLHNNWLQTDQQKRYREILFHSIRADQAMKNFSVASKFNTSWTFISELKEMGRQVATDWLEHNFEKLGSVSSCNLQSEFIPRSLKEGEESLNIP